MSDTILVSGLVSASAFKFVGGVEAVVYWEGEVIFVRCWFVIWTSCGQRFKIYICGVQVVEGGVACASRELSPKPQLEIMVLLITLSLTIITLPFPCSSCMLV